MKESLAETTCVLETQLREQATNQDEQALDALKESLAEITYVLEMQLREQATNHDEEAKEIAQLKVRLNEAKGIVRLPEERRTSDEEAVERLPQMHFEDFRALRVQATALSSNSRGSGLLRLPPVWSRYSAEPVQAAEKQSETEVSGAPKAR